MKKIVSGLLAAAMAFTSVGLPVMNNGAHTHIETGIVAHAESYDFSYSELDDNCVMLTRYYGSDTDVIVPSEINGYRVAALEKTFSGNKNIKSVTIPESVEAIGEDTFYNCTALESVQIGENVKGIGEYAFGKCTALKEITLPQSFEYIGKKAFYNCSALTDVTVNGNVSRVKEETFSGCSALKSVNFAANCVERIDKNAFTGCKELSEISGLDSLKELGTDVFTDTAWLATKKQESPLVTAGYVLIDGKNYAEEDLTIPDGIVMIADKAFKGNTNIKGLTLPQSVERIGDMAFNMCNKLSNISVPETLDDFGYWCFGATPWMDAQKKDSDYVTLNSVLLYMKNSKGNIVIPDGVVGISDGFFKNSRDLLSVQFPEGLKFIGRNSFENCYYLEEVTLPEGLEEIREGAFYDSQNIVSVYMPQSVTEIGEYAFYYCCGMQDLTLSQNITQIKDYTFYGCSKLKEFYVPQNVTYIGEAAVGSGTKLNGGDVYIHGGVAEMANDALIYNSGVYYSGTEEEFNSISRPVYDLSVNELRRMKRIKYEQHPDIVEPIGDQSCTSEGVERHTCRVCGRVVEQTAPPKAHNYGEWNVIEEATCTAMGTRERTCLDCGYAEKAKYGPVHDYEWKVVKEPTCDRYGTSKGVCKVCGNTTKVYPSALGHDYGERVKVAPTCTKDGYYISSCSRCTRKNTRPSGEYATGHTSGEWVIEKEPTCQEYGKKSRYCTVCGAMIQSTIILKTSCKYGEWAVTKEPTCVEEGEKQRACEYCGQIETETISKTSHSYGDWVVTKEPTCDWHGYKEKACTVCGNTIKEYIDALGHDLGEYVKIAPTCTKDGYYQSSCSRCTFKDIKPSGERKTGHTSGDWVIEKEATCQENGKKSRYCTVCGGRLETSIIYAIPCDYGDWEITTKPTCTEDGEKQRICKNCGKIDKAVVKATGHSYSDWEYSEPDIEKRCEADSYRTKTCSGCGDVIKEELTAHGHQFSDWYSNKQFENQEEECELERECRVCKKTEHKTFSHEWVETIFDEPTCERKGFGMKFCRMCYKKESFDIPAYGHDYIKAIDSQEATCTESGYYHVVCSRCHSESAELIPALGHDFTEMTIVKKPTCTSGGNGIHECKRCGMVEEVELLEADHTPVTERNIQPTCTKDGLKGKKHCSVCNEVIDEGKVIPKLGHSYGSWRLEKQPTTAQTGLRSRECTRCSYLEIEVIPKIRYDISSAAITLSHTKYTYTGKAKKPAITVIFSGKKLKANTDYTVKYSNNIAAGQAKVTITGKGGYKGTVVKYFKILPAKQKIKAVTPLANSFAVTWTKDSGVTGYQVMYGTKSDFSDGKSAYVTKNTSVKKTIKGLKAKKTYYVKVRSYKKVSNSKYYGAWSDTQKVKTK